jgi:thiamine-phosphate pyrophosphorylase
LLLYYITDRKQFPGVEFECRQQLLQRIAEAARCGVDHIQLRERDLPSRELELLAKAAVQKVRESGSATRLLINSRADIALAVSADGVHLRAMDVNAGEVRKIWKLTDRQDTPTVAVSCHTEVEVITAKDNGADFVVFAPIFEKQNATRAESAGIERVRSACQHDIPVLALGGVTVENANSCLESGAAGVAGIRLFQDGDLAETVRILRTLY